VDHEFTLILAGPVKIDRQTEDALFEAGCDDALLGSRDGVVFLDFARTADSFSEAVSTAIRDVRTAGFDVLRVEPDDLVSASEIARRTKRTRQSIRQLSTGARGPGGFPPPFARLKSTSPLWRWTDIAKWFSDHSVGSRNRDAANSFEQAETIGRVNAVLEAQRLMEGLPQVRIVWRSLRPQSANRKRTKVVVKKQRGLRPAGGGRRGQT
jgi:hypothetical protein